MKRKVPKEKWVWMPHHGHLIVGSMCRFRLNTRIGKYLVSTVGEYVPDSGVRRIFRESRGWGTDKIGDAEEFDFKQRTATMRGTTIIGYGEEIGAGRKYETMVFKVQKGTHGCCPYEMQNPSNIDGDGYNTAEDAYKGHMKMCDKYSKK